MLCNQSRFRAEVYDEEYIHSVSLKSEKREELTTHTNQCTYSGERYKNKPSSRQSIIVIELQHKQDRKAASRAQSQHQHFESTTNEAQNVDSTMSNSTNLTTTGPGASCRFIGSMAAPSWVETNFTGASCSVPNCEDNRDAMEKCCTDSEINTFNHTVNAANFNANIEYLTCNINANATQYDQYGTYNPDEPYQRYMDCLVREGASRMVCNMAGPRGATSRCSGGSTSITTVAGSGGDDWTTVCGVNTDNENATGSLTTCCMSIEGTIRSELYGCEMSCTGDERLGACISINNKGWPTYCANRSERADNPGSSGTSAIGGSEKMTMVGVLALSVAVVLATLH